MDEQSKDSGGVETEWVTTDNNAPGLVRPSLKRKVIALSDLERDYLDWLTKYIPEADRRWFVWGGLPQYFLGLPDKCLVIKFNKWRVAYSRVHKELKIGQHQMIDRPDHLREVLGMEAAAWGSGEWKGFSFKRSQASNKTYSDPFGEMFSNLYEKHFHHLWEEMGQREKKRYAWSYGPAEKTSAKETEAKQKEQEAKMKQAWDVGSKGSKIYYRWKGGDPFDEGNE